MRNLYILLISLLMVSCNSLIKSSNSSKKTIWISSIKKENENQELEYQIQETEVLINGTWSTIKGEIKKFTPKFGMIYQIEVKETIEKTETNEPVTQYKLVKIIKEQIDTSIKLNDLWGLKSINGKPLAHGTVGPRIEIQLTKDKMMGKAFCNQISSSVNALNNKIKFGKIFSTRMACKDLNLENEFFKILGNELYYKFGKNELILYNAISKTELRFKKLD